MAYAPMMWNERGIGAIGVSRLHGGFSDKELALLRTFADQAVIAIENARLFNETKEALEQQTASAEVLQVISNSVADAAPVFEKILDSCQHLFATDQLGMFLLGADGLLHTGAFRGALLEGVKDTFPRPIDETTSGLAIRRRQPVYIADVLGASDTPPASRAVAERAGNYSAVFAPMLWEGTGIGSIVVLRQPPQPFTDKEIRLLKTFADQAVIAIQNARLFNETKEALEQQTATAEVLRVISDSPTDVQPVFDAIAERAKLLCGAMVSAVSRFDGQLVHLVAYDGVSSEVDAKVRASFPMPPSRESISARAILEKTAVQVEDIHAEREFAPALIQAAEEAGYRSNLSVPMFKDGQVVGSITVCRAETGPFPERQIKLLQTFADQAVIAIENVRLFRETQEALEQQTASAEILRVISSSVADAQPVFDKIVDTGQQLFQRDAVGLFVVDEQAQVQLRALRGDWAAAIAGNYPRPVAQTSFPRVAREGHVLVFPDVLHGSDVPESVRQIGVLLGNVSLLVAAMRWQGQAIGAVTVTRRPPAPFADKEVAVLQTFADQAVIAIQNAQLFKQTQEARAAGRSRQRSQERLPGDDEPRDPHADERRHRHERAAARHAADRRAARLRRHHPRQRRRAADDHQRHPRLLEDRGRAHGHRSAALRPARMRRIGARPGGAARGRQTPGPGLCLRKRGAGGDQRRRHKAAPGPAQPAGQRGEVHARRRGGADGQRRCALRRRHDGDHLRGARHRHRPDA